MSAGFFQIFLYFVTLAVCIKPLGQYIARIFSQDRPLAWCQPLERLIYAAIGKKARCGMSARDYSMAVLAFSVVSIAIVYAIQRTQAFLPWNPVGLPNVSPDSSFNTAISFVTNTNWQGYSGEVTMSYFTQAIALTVQNFLSAAGGLAVFAAATRGFTQASMPTIGNFYVDVTRGTLYLLLPLSMVLAIALVSQGVVQTLDNSRPIQTLETLSAIPAQLPQTEPSSSAANGTSSNTTSSNPEATGLIAVGPAASQVAIKQLGTNGGGFFNANSAHPLENPTPLSNFLQLLAILLIPASLCYSFGQLVDDRRQGWTLLVAMSVVFIPMVFATYYFEQQPNPRIDSTAVDALPTDSQSGGNMEGKETRFGIANSALWAVATTAASNGSVNAMHDSFSPLGGLIPLWLIQLGEVIFGGVGSGLYGMIVFAIVTVFIAGLMVGRTPEYLGKKIGAFEMKMVSLAILIPCAATLVGTAFCTALDAGRASVFNPGPHGFTELLYAVSSAANNNGSAFAGLSANTPFYNFVLGVVMLLGRFGVIFPVLAISGSLASQRKVPAGAGTLPTHTPLFVTLLVSVVLLVGALSFLPALALGPIVEHLQLYSNNG